MIFTNGGFTRFAALGIIVGARLLAAEETTSTTLRRLAWLEGEFENGYQVSRGIAAEKLKRWQGAVPDVKDQDAYLAYLSTLDASASGADKSVEKRLKDYLIGTPDDRRAIFVLGVHYFRSGKKGLAEYFFSSLEKESEFVWKSLLYNNLGIIALNEGRKQVAIDYFEKAMNAKPAVAAPFMNLGAIYLEAGAYADSETLFLRAAGLDPQLEDATLGLGAALEGLGRFQEAADRYQKYLGENPGALSVLFNQALVLGGRLNQRQRAAELLLQYIQNGGRETARAQKVLGTYR